MSRRIRIVRDVVPIALVALLVCHLIRAHVLEWYLVPSASMLPTLRGDPVDGDLVLVDKTAFWFGEPERFDMVVVRTRDEIGDGQVVKRLVARGGDAAPVVRVAEGDVFVGGSRQNLRRLVKHPDDAREFRFTHFAHPGVGPHDPEGYFVADPVWTLAQGRIALSPAAEDLAGLAGLLPSPEAQRPPSVALLPGHLSTRRPVDTTFLDDRGERHGGSGLYLDVGIELEVVIEPGCRGLQIVFEHADHAWALQYDPLGRARLLEDGVMVVTDFRTRVPLRAGATTSIAFGYLDGSFFLEVDGVVVMHRATEVPLDAEGASPRSGPWIHVAAAGAPVRLPAVWVFHDVYYKPLRSPVSQPETFELQPGEMFLLGDNSFDSRDSRSGRTYPREDLVGRPLAVIGPPTRMRWLTR